MAISSIEIEWITSLMHELVYSFIATTKIFWDNMSAIYYSANPIFHSRIKHLAIYFHYVREKVQTGSLNIIHISREDQVVYVLTKPFFDHISFIYQYYIIVNYFLIRMR